MLFLILYRIITTGTTWRQKHEKKMRHRQAGRESRSCVLERREGVTRSRHYTRYREVQQSVAVKHLHGGEENKLKRDAVV